VSYTDDWCRRTALNGTNNSAEPANASGKMQQRYTSGVMDYRSTSIVARGAQQTALTNCAQKASACK